MADTEKLIKTPENYSALASTEPGHEEVDQDLQPKRYFFTDTNGRIDFRNHLDSL
jgi:hypothetical protein